MIFPRDFHFEAPYAALHLFWLIPLAWFVIWGWKERKRSLNALISSRLQRLVADLPGRLQMGIRFACFSAGWLFAILALMQPLGDEYYQGKPLAKEEAALRTYPEIDLYIVIDTSSSMAVTDARNGASRLEGAKEIADRLIAKDKRDPAALWSLTDGIYPIVPLTYDTIFVRLMLRDLSYNEGDLYGTNLDKMLKTVQQEVLSKGRQAAIILFSDGGDNNLEGLKGNERKQALEKFQNEIKKTASISFYTVGMGSLQGGVIPNLLYKGAKVTSKLDEEVLQVLSRETAGRYFSASQLSTDDLAGAINNLLERKRYSLGSEEGASYFTGIYHDYFQIPLFLSCLFFMLALWLPGKSTRLGALVLILGVWPAFGGAVDPGSTLFEAKNFDAAALWYKGELKQYPPPWLRDKLFYNLGTAYASMGNWEEASRFYQAISQEAYHFSIFRTRLIYNQAFALWKLGEKDPSRLQEALFTLWIALQGECLEPAKNSLCKDQNLNQLIDHILKDLEGVKRGGLSFSFPHAALQMIAYAEKPSLLQIESLERLLIPEFQKALNPLLAKTKDFLAKGNVKEARFWLLNADRATVRLMAAHAKTPQESLEELMNESLLISALRGALPQNSPVPQEYGEGILQDAGRFQQTVYNAQKTQFNKGGCVCYPWNLVIPLFEDGVNATRAAIQAEPNLKLAGLYQESAYWKWEEALESLRTSPYMSKSPEEQSSLRDEVRELQEMQALDRGEKKQVQQNFQEGKLW